MKTGKEIIDRWVFDYRLHLGDKTVDWMTADINTALAEAREEGRRESQAETPAERRRYALLQAAATIHWTYSFNISLKHCIDATIKLLDEIERREAEGV